MRFTDQERGFVCRRRRKTLVSTAPIFALCEAACLTPQSTRFFWPGSDEALAVGDRAAPRGCSAEARAEHLKKNKKKQRPTSQGMTEVSAIVLITGDLAADGCAGALGSGLRGGFYAWLTRRAVKRSRSEMRVGREVRAIFLRQRSNLWRQAGWVKRMLAKGGFVWTASDRGCCGYGSQSQSRRRRPCRPIWVAACRRRRSQILAAASEARPAPTPQMDPASRNVWTAEGGSWGRPSLISSSRPCWFGWSITQR